MAIIHNNPLEIQEFREASLSLLSQKDLAQAAGACRSFRETSDYLSTSWTEARFLRTYEQCYKNKLQSQCHLPALDPFRPRGKCLSQFVTWLRDNAERPKDIWTEKQILTIWQINAHIDSLREDERKRAYALLKKCFCDLNFHSMRGKFTESTGRLIAELFPGRFEQEYLIPNEVLHLRPRQNHCTALAEASGYYRQSLPTPVLRGGLALHALEKEVKGPVIQCSGKPRLVWQKALSESC